MKTLVGSPEPEEPRPWLWWWPQPFSENVCTIEVQPLQWQTVTMTNSTTWAPGA